MQQVTVLVVEETVKVKKWLGDVRQGWIVEDGELYLCGGMAL